MAGRQAGAKDVRWDLSDLYSSREGLEQDLDQADQEAEEFAGQFRGRIAKLDAAELDEALDEYEDIQDRLGRIYAYAYLNWSTDTGDAERGALLQKVRETHAQISKKLIFVEVEWAELEDEQARELIKADALSSYRHYLEVERLAKEYVLSESEEQVLSEKNVTGRSAWNRFFDETMGAARYELDGEELTQQEILSKLYEPDRQLRRKAAFRFTEGLEEHQRELTFIFNTILADKASEDRLRGYPHWLASRNLANEVKDETVDALVQAVTGRYGLVARFYELKRSLLDLDELYDYDRYAPVGEASTQYQWNEARQVVQEAYEDFHPEMGKITGFFFDQHWIDAPVKPGKRGGAFSHGTVPSSHPYVLLNYTGKARDVQTLAHELGHGVHQYLARRQGVLQASTPLTTAEMASVFGEMLVFQRLMAREEDPTNRLAMLVSKIDDTIATVFRQIAMNRFEDRLHHHRRNEGELTSQQFSDLWIETQEAMFEGSVTLGEHYQSWWSYIPHFLHTPGYVYAYAFGELLVLSLYARYQESGRDYADSYIRLLEAGGSEWPFVLVSKLGLDLTDQDFWEEGLDAIEDLIESAELLAGSTSDGSAQ